MEINVPIPWIGVLAAFASLGIFVGSILVYFWFSRKKNRYSPFTEDALRLPGHSLRAKHTDKCDDLILHYFAYLFTVIGAFLAALFLPTIVGQICIFALGLFMMILLHRNWKLIEAIRATGLGLDGEVYAGQELNLLMCRGAHVFHDIPYQYGNIDHIVIGAKTVFVVETKAVRKPQSKGKDSKKQADVSFDGRHLLFPHFKSEEPVHQVKRHANHLRQVLKKQGIQDIEVVPVIALPGWNVHSQYQGSDVLVINPKRGKALDKWLGTKTKNANRTRVVAHIASVARSVPSRSDLSAPNANSKYDFWLNPKRQEVSLM